MAHFIPSSLVAIGYGILRYWQQKKSLKIINDEAFFSATEAFSTVTTELKKTGEGRSKLPS